MKLTELTVDQLIQCETRATDLCKRLYGEQASDFAQMICEVATLYHDSVPAEENGRCYATVEEILCNCSAYQLASFFEQYYQAFLQSNEEVQA